MFRSVNWPLLRQLSDNAGGGGVVHYEPSNVLLITGRAAVVNRLVEVVRRVDKAGIRTWTSSSSNSPPPARWCGW